MELLEVFRRFIWIFFRVETEWGEFVFLIFLSFILPEIESIYYIPTYHDR